MHASLRALPFDVQQLFEDTLRSEHFNGHDDDWEAERLVNDAPVPKVDARTDAPKGWANNSVSLGAVADLYRSTRKRRNDHVSACIT